MRLLILGNKFYGNFPENLYFNIGAITIFNFNHFMPNLSSGYFLQTYNHRFLSIIKELLRYFSRRMSFLKGN